MREDQGLWHRWRWIIIGAAGLFLVIWWLLPPLLYRHTGATAEARLKAITDTRTALLAGLVGVGALLTFFLNSRTHRLTEQGQITDRYSKAVDQLGSETLDVRLGGIYALERIVYDSPRQYQDQATIVEVLSAFVRVHSDPVYRLREHEAVLKLEHAEEDSLERTRETELRLAEQHVKEYDLPVDVQAAVTVLGRLPQRFGISRGNLKGAYLAGADLTNAHLEEANLWGVCLNNAVAWDAYLRGINLDGAHLENADLNGTNLTNANLTGAHLRNTNLESAILQGANLKDADLTEARLNSAELGLAKGLTWEQLERAYLDDATLLPDGVTRDRELAKARTQPENPKGRPQSE